MSNYFSRQYQRWGFKKAVYSSLMAMLSKWFGIQIAILNTRDFSNASEVPEVPEDYRVKILDEAELQSASEQADLDISPEFITQAVADGGYCAGAFHKDQLVSYVWRAYRSTPIHDRLVLNFPAPIRYGYKALTLPEYRGLHLQHAIALYSETHDRAAGYTEHLAFIETHNYPSIISDERRGNQVIGYLVWIDNRFLNWSFVSKSARSRGINTHHA